MRVAKPFLLAVWLAVSAACGDSEPWLASPSAPTAMATPSPTASRDGTPIQVGDTVSGTISPSDPTCGTEFGNDPQEPCQLFEISVPASGILTVQVTSPGPSGLTLRFGPSLQWGTTIRLNAVVQAGASYEIGVALHDGRSAASQTFELTTSLEPS